MSGYDAQIRVNTKVDTSSMKSLQAQIEKATANVERLVARQKELANTKIPTQDYKDVKEQIDQAKVALDKLEDKKIQMLDAGKIGTSAWDSLVYKVNELKNTIKYAKGEMQDLVDTGKAFTPGTDTEEYESVTKGLGIAQQRLDALQTKSKDAFDKMADSAKAAGKEVNKLGDGVKKTHGMLSTFASRLKGILLSLLIFNWISKAWNAMITGLKAGLDNLVQYSGSANSAMSGLVSSCATLKNAMAAAFEPVLEMIVPILTQLINWLVSAANAVSYFFAVLGGKSSYTKAIQQNIDYAKSLKKTGAAAKEAAGHLAAFDELNVLQKDNKSDDGGGELTGADAFTTQAIDQNGKLAKVLDDAKKKAKELKDIFTDGFFDGFNNGSDIFQDMMDHLDHLKKVLSDIWNDSEVSAARGEWVNSFVYALGQIAGAAADIAVTIGDNLIGGLDEYFTQNEDRVKQWLIDMFNIGTEINTIVGNFASAFAYVFEAFASDEGIQLTANLIGIFTDAFMGVIEIVGKLARDILTIIMQPFIDNKDEIRRVLTDVLGVIAEVLGTIKDVVDEFMDGFNSMYDEHLKPFFDDIAAGLSEILALLLNVFETYILPYLQILADKLSELNENYIKPFFDQMSETFGNLIDLLDEIWNNVLVPLIEWLIANILPVVGPIFLAVSQSLIDLVATILDFMTKCLQYLNAVIDFLKLVFKGEWGKAWDMIADLLSNVWDRIVQKIKDHVNNIIDAIEDMVNKCISGINSIIDGLNSIASFKMPEWAGGGTVGLSIPDLKNVNIPHLATGDVITGGNPFLALLGDQPRGQTNIEAPLDTIKQAVREELSGYGGAGINTVIVNMDGSEVARVTLDDFIGEINRRGISVDTVFQGV